MTTKPSTAPHRMPRGAAEEDAFSKWGRRYLCYIQRAGVRSSIKRDYRRRERRISKQELRKETP